VWDWLRSVLGETTTGEVVLAAVLFICVLGFSWMPRIGEAVGALFDDPDAADDSEERGPNRPDQHRPVEPNESEG